MPSTTQATPGSTDPANLFPFDSFLHSKGLTRITGYRYRKRGLVDTVNVFGRLYITRDEIARFERRAIAGEFSRETYHPPSRQSKERAKRPVKRKTA